MAAGLQGRNWEAIAKPLSLRNSNRPKRRHTFHVLPTWADV